MGKILLRAVIIGLVAMLLFGLYMYFQIKPDYVSDVQSHLLDNDVVVYYDTYGVPHIETELESDAFFAMGYVHATDRLWQMDVIRKIAPGRLSELFGESTIETDTYFRTLGIEQYSKRMVDKVDVLNSPHANELSKAYLAGINAFLSEGNLPAEYKLLGLEQPENFDLLDVYNVMGYMAFSFAHGQKTDPLLEKLKGIRNGSLLQFLDVELDTSTQILRSYVSDTSLTAYSSMINDLVAGIKHPPFIGSNSWVIGPNKTASGKVILANDPHISYSQPSVWYEGHIKTNELDVYGYFLAGYPFPVLSHSEDKAIGITMLENDDMNLYNLDATGDSYRFDGINKPITVRTEIIKVHNGEDRKIDIRETEIGPIVSDVLKVKSPDQLAMWWNYLKHDSKNLELTYQLMRAKNIESYLDAASLLHAPGLSLMYGDKNGNIAWVGAAKIPQFREGLSTKFILDGTSSKDLPQGYYDFKDNPKIINPPQGFVYSANNRVQMENGIYPYGYYLPQDRANRIHGLLSQKDRWTVEDVKHMLLDFTSNFTIERVKILTEDVDMDGLSEHELEVLNTLKGWNGEFDKESVVPVMYTTMLHTNLKNMFLDEMSQKDFELLRELFVIKRSYEKIFSKENPIFDDIRTDEVESKSEMVTKSFKESVAMVTKQHEDNMSAWRWGSVHHLNHPHAFADHPSLGPMFSVQGLEVGGYSEVINNYLTPFSDSTIHVVVGGPSTRRIIDFENMASNSWSILPTGQSGNILSKHYKDQSQMFANGTYRYMDMNPERYQKTRTKKMFRSVEK